MLARAQASRRPFVSEGRTVQATPRNSGPIHGATGLTLEAASRFGHRFEAPPSLQPIQRVLDPKKLAGLPHELRSRLTESVERFNKRDSEKVGRREHEEHLGSQFQELHDLERHANGYLRDNPHGVSDEARLGLFDFLRETEAHHVGLTAKSLKAGHDLWLPKSVKGKERERAQGLYRNIASGKSNIGISSDREAFHYETLSGLGKLLQGQHGRDLIEELDAPQADKERRIEISDDFKGRFKQDPESFALGQAAALRDEDRHTLKQGKANEGTGSFVRIYPEPPPKTIGEHQTGVRGEAIHAPSFITLGHELGHARQNLRGTAGTQSWFSGAQITDKSEQVRWSNPEEHRNITQDENALRAEHGLAPRRYHKTIDSQRSEVARSELTGQLEKLADGLPRGPLKGQLGQLHNEIHKADLSNPKSIDAYRKRVNSGWRQAMWHHTKSYGKKALPYLGAAAVLGLGWAAKSYFGY